MRTRTQRFIGTCTLSAGIAVAGAILMTRTPFAAAPRFLDDDPIAREPDSADASRVQPFPVHLTWDLVSSLFAKEGVARSSRAQDVNTIDAIPDSSWFTNRLGSQPLSEADVARGPDTTAGPAPGVWTVVAGKSEGVRPGFTIVDSNGMRWFVKFDGPGSPEQATGAEVVSTKLFWALGYDVAETHVATVRRDAIQLADDAVITLNGRRRRMTAGDVNRVLEQADRSPDGSYRALASKALEGKPVGEFLYYGTRADDPNDVVPHELRRELRGMRVFAAWIDRVDAKAGNTLDTLVVENGRSIVRHHPLDFGSTLGSGGDGPNEYWEGYEYLYAGGPLLKRLFGFGLPIEPWRTIHYPAFRGIGRFEGDHFDPDAWKSRVPNAAYIRADADDTFWAARKVMAATEPMIAAAVQAGKYSDPSAARYLVRTLVQRRNAIGRAYLGSINPIVDPTLDADGILRFTNAAVATDLFAAPASYRVEWSVFDNLTGETVGPLGRTESRNETMTGPPSLPRDIGAFVRVDIAAIAPERPAWESPVHAFFRKTIDGWTLVGLERLDHAERGQS